MANSTSRKKIMTNQRFNNPKTQLRDNLYDLQALREIADKDPELALFGDEIHESCNVFIDLRTGDRIITTELPIDEDEFSGAKVSISNLEAGVKIDSDKTGFMPQDVLFAIDKALKVTRIDPRTGKVSQFDTEELAERICVPRIKPVAQSEYDFRQPPHAYELLSTPEKCTYTLASGIYDQHTEEQYSLIVDKSGILDCGDGKSTVYDLRLYEVLPGKRDVRLTEFDREFILLLFTGDEVRIAVQPWGERDEQIGRGEEFKFKIYREGFIVDMLRGGKIVHCSPNEETINFVNRILENAQ